MDISTAALPSLVQLYTLIGNTSLGLRGGSPNICSTPVTLPSLLTHIQSSNSLQLPHSLSKQSICQRRPRSRPWLHYQRSVRCASTTNDIPSDSLKLLLGVGKAILGASILVLPIYDRTQVRHGDDMKSKKQCSFCCCCGMSSIDVPTGALRAKGLICKGKVRKVRYVPRYVEQNAVFEQPASPMKCPRKT